MHVFFGVRLIDPSECEVFVDGIPLPMLIDEDGTERSTGFEWGYGGQGPRSLAAAIMLQVFGEQYGDALASYFREVIEELPRLGWVLTEAEIYQWYAALTDQQLAECDFWDGQDYVTLLDCSALSPFQYPHLHKVTNHSVKPVVSLLR